MTSIKNKLWLFGHPENCLYGTFKLDKESHVTPLEGLREFGLENLLFVPYKHEADMEEEFNAMQENTTRFGWSIEDRDDVEKLLHLKKDHNKLVLGLFDDFLNPENPKNIDYFTFAGLKEFKQQLNAAGIEMWMVYYEKQIDIDITPYLELFDGVSFWFWKEPQKDFFLDTMARFIEKTPGKKRMIGTYLYNFGMRLPADPANVLFQLEYNKKLIEKGKLDGIILHNNAISGMGFAAYDTAIEWCKKQN